MCKQYNTEQKEKIAFYVILIILAIVIGGWLGMKSGQAAADRPATAWILCRPGTQVNARRTPDGGGQIVGYLEVGDEILTDGVSAEGYIRALNIGEYGEAWIWCGYIVTEKPVEVFEQYCCVAKNRVAVRRWCDGPQVEGRKWLRNGDDVTVFHMADGWACTNIGYIRSEWLEVDPQ